jgi:hypothetical protein
MKRRKGHKTKKPSAKTCPALNFNHDTIHESDKTPTQAPNLDKAE